MKRLAATACAALTVLGLPACSSSASLESASPSCTKGKDIDLVVPFSPGGGYDQYARQLAPALAKELGARIVVINKPGAGGLLATNELAKGPKDGTQIEILNMTGHLGAALADADGVNYDPNTLGYLGRISSEPDVVLVQSGSDYKTFEDLEHAGQVRFAATGPGSNEYIDPVLFRSILGMDIKIVTGYEGGSEAALGLLQGDVDAHTRSLYSQLPAVNDGDARAVLIVGDKPVEELGGVPTLVDLAQDDDQRALLQFHSRLIQSGRAFAVPPGTSEKCLNHLREAFETVVTDDAFTSEAAKAGRPVSFASGKDVQDEVAELMKAPPRYVEVLRDAFNG